MSAITVDLSPLRDSPGYRALWIGQVITLLGTQMRQVAVPVQVYDLTRSSVDVGLIGLVEVVPLIFFSIAGGALADRFDRRALMAWAQLGLMGASGGLAAITLTGRPSLGWVYGFVALSSAFASLDRPTRSAMLPHLVEPHQLSAAMALRQVLFQVTQIAGPLLAAALFPVVSIGWIYVVDAASFITSLMAVYWVPRLPTIVTERSGWEAVKEGLAFSFRTPVLLAIFLTDLSAMIFGMPRAVFPALAHQVFHLGNSAVGFMYAAPAVGAVVAAATTGWIERIEHQGRAVIAAVTLWGAAIMGAGLATFSFAVALVLLAIAGGADVLSAVFRGTMLLETTPDQLRGRTSAANLMVVTGGPRLGDVEAGAVAAAIGPALSVVVGGAACLIGTFAIAARFRAFRDYRRSQAPYRGR